MFQMTISLKCAVCDDYHGCSNYGSTEMDCGGSCGFKIQNPRYKTKESEYHLFCTYRRRPDGCDNINIGDGDHIKVCYCNTENCNKDFVKTNSAVKIGLNVLLLVLANKLSI